MSTTAETPKSPKEVVLSFCRSFDAKDVPALFALAAPTATWWIIGRPELGTAWGGTKTFEETRPVLDAGMARFVKFAFAVESVTAEEERVVVEATVRGESAKGARYRNDILMVFTVRDGKIQTLKEYNDPKAVEAYMAANAA